MDINISNKRNIIIEIIKIIKLLMTEAKTTANVTSVADNGAINVSTMFPWIFAIMMLETLWEKAC